MASFDAELLDAALVLIERPDGKRGALPRARIRRSISTSYYALFHFILNEVTNRVVGSDNNLRARRRMVARSITHAGAKLAFTRARGGNQEGQYGKYLSADDNDAVTPAFIKEFSNAFIDAQAKRHDADYDMNVPLGEVDARLLHARVTRVISEWKSANTLQARDLKHALSVLILLSGNLKSGS